MNRKRTIWALALVFVLSGAAGFASLTRSIPAPPFYTKAETAKDDAASDSEKLIGNWKLVSASVTPDFLKVPIPINTFEAEGSITVDRNYTIEANGSFFGSNYGYLGNGAIDIQGNNLTLHINEGIITVNEKKKKKDRKGKTITGSYRITGKDTLFVEASKDQDGIRYTFNLALVNF